MARLSMSWCAWTKLAGAGCRISRSQASLTCWTISACTQFHSSHGCPAVPPSSPTSRARAALLRSPRLPRWDPGAVTTFWGPTWAAPEAAVSRCPARNFLGHFKAKRSPEQPLKMWGELVWGEPQMPPRPPIFELSPEVPLWSHDSISEVSAAALHSEHPFCGDFWKGLRMLPPYRRWFLSLGFV